MKNQYKILISILLIAFTIGLKAQTFQEGNTSLKVSPKEWEKMKSEGKSMGGVVMDDANVLQEVIHPIITRSKGMKSISCNGMMQVYPLTGIDSTGFQVAPLTLGVPPIYSCDDGSTAAITLPFTFHFYGQNYTAAYINNNGNISFGNSYGTYSPVGLQGASQKMVAAFWSDVDTRPSVNWSNHPAGIVFYKVTPTALIVRWDSIGYYNMHTDKVNDFQVIITNGTDSLIPGGNNVMFSYGVMQWTTGDASQGNNGFVDTTMNNGSPAAVGATNADGINYVQFGLFGRPGVNSSQPNPPFPYSGISWLNNKSFTFSTNGATNIPPVVSWLSTCDTIHICIGDTLNIPLTFMSPEVNQITTDTAICNIPGFSIISQVSGNVASITAQVAASILNIGNHTINFSATDNGSPVATTNYPVAICVDTGCGCTAQFTLTADSMTAHLYWIVNLASGAQPLHYNWSWGDATYDTIQYPNHQYANAGIYNICLTITDANGCTSTHCSSFNLLRTDNTMIFVNVVNPNFTTGTNANPATTFCTIFPNPFHDKTTLSIQGLGVNSTTTLQIYDLFGREVKRMAVGSNKQITIGREDLLSGMYFYKLTDGNATVLANGKLVVE